MEQSKISTHTYRRLNRWPRQQLQCHCYYSRFCSCCRRSRPEAFGRRWDGWRDTSRARLFVELSASTWRRRTAALLCLRELTFECFYIQLSKGTRGKKGKRGEEGFKNQQRATKRISQKTNALRKLSQARPQSWRASLLASFASSLSIVSLVHENEAGIGRILRWRCLCAQE